MLSMTGFGSGEGQSGPVTVAVEMRSVNHRFLDVSLKLPGALASLESDVRGFLKDHLARGRITVSAQLSLVKEESDAGIDADRLRQALRMLQEAAAALEKVTGERQRLTLEHLLAVPDVFRSEDPELDPDDIRRALLAALEASLAGLMAMKTAEGDSLVAEMRQRLAVLDDQLAEVRKLAPTAAQEIHARLTERVAKLANDAVEPQRLAQEVALLADRANINEECERLGIHIEQFIDALDKGGQVAKRLNFLLQEMHREVNTMGSKTNVMDITQLVITMKDEVESLREQVQNLE